jgi:hypothetical protein
MPFSIYPAPAEMQLGTFDTPSSTDLLEPGGRFSTHVTPVDPSQLDDFSVPAMITYYIFIFVKSLGLELLSIIGMVTFQLLLTYLINKYHGEFTQAIRRSVPTVLLPFVLPVAFIISRICCTRHPAALRVIDVIEEGIQMSETPSHRPLVDLTNI